MSADVVRALSVTVTRRAGPGPGLRLVLLAALAGVAIVMFLTLGVNGHWDFALPFRGRKVLAMAVVGCAIALSTVMFQTITNNRILTPSIMGFDALYMLIQTLAIFFLGSVGLIQLGEATRFGVEVVAMTGFAGALYWWLFVAVQRSLDLLVLVGIVFGVMFRSVTELLQRVIDPTEFAVLQDAGFASFNAVNESLLGVTTIIVLLAAFGTWRLRHALDVLALGRDVAIGLGVNHRRATLVVLSLATVLVSVATALVGPVAFFGLLVAHLAYITIGSSEHRFTLPAAALIAVTTLVGGQSILERAFAFDTSLSIVIDFAGGALFLFLLQRGAVR